MEKIVAYILLLVDIGKEYSVAEKVKQLNGVSEVKVVYGEYDVVVRVEVDSLKKLDKVVTSIRSIPHIIRSITLVSSS
ncbi:MAG TPA: Lrp/AsnC family transcriptional regulator [Desulfurococcales archaeon]|nr:Lrp/AsnC family transcriptional regulator [Desulfurococcales archaeon]